MPAKAKSVPRATAHQSALRRLARRDHSKAELRRALRRQGHAPEAIDEALARLASYLGDRGFATRFARTRMAHAGHGPLRVRADLRQRGVSPEHVEAGLREATEERPLEQTIAALAETYWRRHTRDAPARRILKLQDYLLRRGFPGGLVRDVLGRAWPDRAEGLREDVEDIP